MVDEPDELGWADGGDGASWPLQYATLVALSHAFEEAYVGTRGAGPGQRLLIGLFQSADRFEVESGRYARFAERALVVAGFTGEARVPVGVHLASLDTGEDLAREWTLVSVGPGCGGALVARDRVDVLDGRPRAGRVLEARWSFRRGVAAREGARVLSAIGDRIGVEVQDRAAALLDEHADVRETFAERSQAEVMENLLARLESQHHRRAVRQEPRT